MVKKEFTYRGKEISEIKAMSEGDFLMLLTARERRTIKRGYNDIAKKAIAKIQKKNNVKIHSRDIVIVPNMIGKTVKVHKGNGYVDVLVMEDMIGHRFGEFALCNKKVTHGKAGLGSSGGTKSETRK